MSGGIVFFFLLVAAAVFMLLQGLMVPAFGDQRRERKALQRRLATIEQELGDGGSASLVRQKFLRTLSPWQRSLENLPGMERLARMIESSGGAMMAHQLVVLSLALGIAGALLCGVLTKSSYGALVGGVLAGIVPLLKLRMDPEIGVAPPSWRSSFPMPLMYSGRAACRSPHSTPQLSWSSDEMDEPVAKQFALTFADISTLAWTFAGQCSASWSEFPV